DPIRLLAQLRHDDPVRPRAVRPAIPRDLETIVLRAIERDPARRYQTATELGDDLGRFLRDEPILARRAGPAERLYRWGRRQPALACTLLCLALVLVASFVAVSLALRYALAGWDQAREQARQAGEQAMRADREADDATRARELAEDN